MSYTIFDHEVNILESDKEYNYQSNLTTRLDNLETEEFNQNIINEIVLWKVNRYARVGHDVLELINGLESNATTIDKNKTIEIMDKLLVTKGIKLPMASTILRFRNKNIYQIIDQRVYRIINKDKTLGQALKGKKTSEQIEVYLQYLEDLTKICKELEIPFNEADRILYMADKRINKGDKLEY